MGFPLRKPHQLTDRYLLPAVRVNSWYGTPSGCRRQFMTCCKFVCLYVYLLVLYRVSPAVSNKIVSLNMILQNNAISNQFGNLIVHAARADVRSTSTIARMYSSGLLSAVRISFRVTVTVVEPFCLPLTSINRRHGPRPRCSSGMTDSIS